MHRSTRSRSKAKKTVTLEKTNMDTNEIKEVLTSLIQGITTTIQTNANMMMESFKNLEDKLEVRMHNLEVKVDKNLVHVTDINNELKTKLDTSVARVDSELFDLKNENQKLKDVLNSKIEELDAFKLVFVQLERSTYGGLQHSRKYNLEVDGFPVGCRDLRGAAVSLFNAMDVECDEDDIEVIHRLKSKAVNKPTIVRFHSRKVVDDIISNKAKLKRMNYADLNIDGIDQNSTFYIRASLCPYYSNLAFNCRKLKKNHLISHTIVGDDGSVKIKCLGEEKYKKVTHAEDLKRWFPTFHEFSFHSTPQD